MGARVIRPATSIHVLPYGYADATCIYLGVCDDLRITNSSCLGFGVLCEIQNFIQLGHEIANAGATVLLHNSLFDIYVTRLLLCIIRI